MDNALFERTKQTTYQFEIDGRELADLFWQLSSSEQEIFFNALGEKNRFAFQLQYVTDGDILNSSGRSAMELIGEYSEKI